MIAGEKKEEGIPGKEEQQEQEQEQEEQEEQEDAPCAVLDFRSDTVTRPGPAMREAMARAEVGDDVFGDDPTVRRLEERVAALFGREASLFVPSGTMGNLISIGIHCRQGDEVILERRTHSFVHEVAGGSAIFGVSFQPFDSPDGILSPEQVIGAVRPDDIHEPISRLVIVENTANLAGGRIVSIERLRALRAAARERGLKLHMDGARVWNAAVATGTPLVDYAREVDTLMCCLSKGLGCPVGSLIVGDLADVERARRLRKMLGGGMRQVGVVAACGLHALDHHIERLAEDHEAARDLARGLRSVLDDRHAVEDPETNILLVRTRDRSTTAETLRRLEERRILALPLSDTAIRFVTHLDLPAGAAGEAAERLAR